MNLSASDPEAQTRIAAFMQGLQELGWTIGRNLRLELLKQVAPNVARVAVLQNPAEPGVRGQLDRSRKEPPQQVASRQFMP